MVFDFQTWAMDDKLMISDDCTATSLRNIAEFKYTVWLYMLNFKAMIQFGRLQIHR